MSGKILFFIFGLITGLLHNPQLDNIRVYFSPGTDCEDNIIHEIQFAKTIDIAIYSITNHDIANAIINAHNNGKNIRIITDRLQSHGKHSLTNTLESAGIPIRTNKHHKIEHNKFAIFDNRMVITGSYNWTESATTSNSENCIFIHNATRQYVNRFEYLWKLYDK